MYMAPGERASQRAMPEASARAADLGALGTGPPGGKRGAMDVLKLFRGRTQRVEIWWRTVVFRARFPQIKLLERASSDSRCLPPLRVDDFSSRSPRSLLLVVPKRPELSGGVFSHADVVAQFQHPLKIRDSLEVPPRG
jgi:hypothetical protein